MLQVQTGKEGKALPTVLRFSFYMIWTPDIIKASIGKLENKSKNVVVQERSQNQSEEICSPKIPSNHYSTTICIILIKRSEIWGLCKVSQKLVFWIRLWKCKSGLFKRDPLRKISEKLSRYICKVSILIYLSPVLHFMYKLCSTNQMTDFVMKCNTGTEMG